MIKVLEHCCYRKYLNEWWQSRGNKDYWQLVHFGDHLMVELLDWCINMCYSTEGVKVNVVMPKLTDQTKQWLESNKQIKELGVVTQEQCPDVHTMVVTVASRLEPHKCFTLQGGLLQAVCPGKYIVTMGLNQDAYESVSAQIESWIRFYNRKK